MTKPQPLKVGQIIHVFAINNYCLATVTRLAGAYFYAKCFSPKSPKNKLYGKELKLETNWNSSSELPWMS